MKRSWSADHTHADHTPPSETGACARPDCMANASVVDECDTVRSDDLWFVGVFLDAIATLAGTGGKQLLRFAVVKNNVWYYPLGLVCTAVIDPAFDVSAYAFAAQSIISPMGAMVVVWNVAIAPCTLGEVLTRTRKVGAALIIFGTLFVGFFGNHNSTERTVDEYLETFARPAAVLYYVAMTAWGAVCCYYWRHGTPYISGFFVGALGGSLAGNMCAHSRTRPHLRLPPSALPSPSFASSTPRLPPSPSPIRFTTKAVVEMLKCVATADPDDPCGAIACAYNPFTTVWPYFFITCAAAECERTCGPVNSLLIV